MREGERLLKEHWKWQEKERQYNLRRSKEMIQKMLKEKDLLFIKEDAPVWYTSVDGTKSLASVDTLDSFGIKINILTNTPGNIEELEELEKIKKREDGEYTEEFEFDFEDTGSGIEELVVPFEEASARLTERTNKYPHIFSYDDAWPDDAWPDVP